jgi:peptidoglycan hydrolase-like protein with peptidoglycan-binding domain
MSAKTSLRLTALRLGLAALAMAAVLAAGIAYWRFHENPQHGALSAGAPTVAPQATTPPRPPVSRSASTAESPVLSTAKPAASITTLPAEDQMSEANRRQIQKILEGMKYYQGPIDGKFGPLSRTAIRRYQESIGAKSTGYLTAAEATRLASTR